MATAPTLTVPSSTLAVLTARPSAGDSNALVDEETTVAASFATHFQRIFAKQGGIDPAATLPEKPEQGDESARSDSLTALPAILDMLDRAQRQAVADSLTTETDNQPKTAPLEAAATALAAPVTPAAAAAISAGAIPADAPRSAAAPLPSSTTPHTPLIAPNSEPGLTAKPDTGIVSSAGREFASHLTSVITAAHEPQSPGATAAAVQQVISNLSPAHAIKDPPGVNIATPVSAPGWTEEVGNRIAWIASQGRSQAELVLNPPQMGRIEVNLTLNGDQAMASFTSSNPVVRELLEAALPRLREALADAGIQLGQAQVGAEHGKHQAQHEKHGEDPVPDLMRIADANAAISSASSGSSSTLAALKYGRGLVDVFA